MKSPKVSICIPAYRQPDLLERALSSIERQTFKDYEVVVTDDSGNDEVANVIDKFKGILPVRYFRNQTALGSPGNWNESVRQAKGEYIKILHHDDWFHDASALADFVELLDSNPGCDFAFGGTHNCDSLGNLKSVHAVTLSEIRKLQEKPSLLFLGNVIGAPSATIYRRVGAPDYDLRMKWLVDIDFYIQILTKNPKFAYTRRPLVSVTVGSPTQVTAASASNRYVEISESLLLKRKLSSIGVRDYFCFRVIWGLLEKHEIRSVDDLQLQEKLDEYTVAEIRSILLFLKPLRRSQLILKNMKELLSPEFWARQTFRFASYIYCKAKVSKGSDRTKVSESERPI